MTLKIPIKSDCEIYCTSEENSGSHVSSGSAAGEMLGTVPRNINAEYESNREQKIHPLLERWIWLSALQQRRRGKSFVTRLTVQSKNVNHHSLFYKLGWAFFLLSYVLVVCCSSSGLMLFIHLCVVCFSDFSFCWQSGRWFNFCSLVIEKFPCNALAPNAVSIAVR